MNRRQLNILLVDDDEQNRIKIQDLLTELENWEVNLEWVSTYETALEKMERGQPDICLLNHHLGQPNGLSFVHQAVKNGITTPLILLTEPQDHRLAVEAMEAGAVDYLVKGQINDSLLERSIRYAVKARQLEEMVEKRVEERTALLTAQVTELQQEINQYQQKVAALRENEQQYRALFDIDIYSVEVLDKKGNIIDCNTTYQQLLGYSREEIIGQPTTAFVTGRSKRVLQKKLPLLMKRGYLEGEVELVRKDGSTLLVWRRAQVIYDETGVFRGAVAYSRDITERMKAVRQISTLARALEQSPLAIMVTNAAGNIEYVNLEFTELTGYAYEEVIDQNLRTFRAEPNSTNNYEDIWNVLMIDKEWQGELHSQRKDGETYWESVTITPMFNSHGVLTHFILVQEDITPRKEAEAEALQSQQRIGNLMTEHIGDLTAANEALQREIAERERAEKALRQSRARFKAQYKGIPIPTYSWQRVGDDFILIDYNISAEKATQGRIADLMGKKAGEIFKERPQVLADFDRCFREKTVIRREAPYRLVATGETRYFVTTYNFVPPNLVIDHIQDITEYKQVEEELKKYQDQLASRAVQAAPELAKIKEDLVNEVIKREQAEQALQESEEKLKQVIGNIDDKLREQYRSIPIPTYSWQMIAGEFVLIDFNDAAAQAMGRIVDFLGKTASQIFKDRPQVLADFARCYNERTTVVREAPYQLVTTGETRYFVTTYNFVRPNLVIDHIQDITEYKQLEEDFKKYRDQLETLTAQHTAELANVKEALQGETKKRQKAKQERDRMEAELKKYQAQLENLATEQTAELTEMNEQLRRELLRQEWQAETLRESRARLRVQYKGIPIPTYSWQRVGRDLVLVDYNDAAEKATRGRIVDFTGRTVKEIFKERPQVLADFERCFTEKRTVTREGPYKLLTTGEIRYFITTYNFVPPNLIITYIEDVTERKQIEEALQIGEEQIELICRFSPEITLTFVNDAYCWYFNQEREELIGLFLPFVLDQDLEKVKTHFASLSQENPVATIEHRVVKPNGAVRWQRWINRAIFDKHGRPIEYWSVGRDITRHKEVG